MTPVKKKYAKDTHKNLSLKLNQKTSSSKVSHQKLVSIAETWWYSWTWRPHWHLGAELSISTLTAQLPGNILVVQWLKLVLWCTSCRPVWLWYVRDIYSCPLQVRHLKQGTSADGRCSQCVKGTSQTLNNFTLIRWYHASGYGNWQHQPKWH